MKKVWIAIMVMALSVTTLMAQDAEKKEDQKLDSVEKKYSYLLGMMQGSNIAPIKDALEVEAFLYGMKDAIEGNDMAMTEAEAEEAKKAFEERMQKFQVEQQEAMQKEGEKNKKAGEDFLAANAKKEGVKTTASGLQYQVLEAKKGDSPDQDSLVTVHYQGALIDETVFDSSYRRGEPAQFHLRQVVPGFSEGIALMNKGEKYRFFMPPALGYGAQSPSPSIPPNSVLIFDVELIDFEKQELPERPAMPMQ